MDSYSFRHNVRDPDVIDALRGRASQLQIDKTPEDILEKIATSNSWNNVDIDVLHRMTVDQFYTMLKSQKGCTLRRVLEALRDIKSMATSDTRYPEIAERAWQALAQIASESVLNAVRLKAYGVEPTPAKKDDGSQEAPKA